MKKNKNVAGILALLLGGFGAHRFYLGQYLLGFVYIITMWTFIPAIVSLVEGLIFLVTSEEDFDKKYNKQFVQVEEPKVMNEKK